MTTPTKRERLLALAADLDAEIGQAIIDILDSDDVPAGPPFGDAVRPMPGQVEAMEDLLLNDGGWVSTREIIARHGWEERAVRAAASESKVISSTSGGYRHIVTAGDDEFNHSMDVLACRGQAQLGRRRWNIWVRRQLLPA